MHCAAKAFNENISCRGLLVIVAKAAVWFNGESFSLDPSAFEHKLSDGEAVATAVHILRLTTGRWNSQDTPELLELIPSAGENAYDVASLLSHAVDHEGLIGLIQEFIRRANQLHYKNLPELVRVLARRLDAHPSRLRFEEVRNSLNLPNPPRPVENKI
jgi:hypothetical protein